MSPKDPQKDATSASPTFDQSLGRLEEIVVDLEGGGLGLELSLERYKEGVGLLKGCRERLAAFRAQVEELKPDGTLTSAGGARGGPHPQAVSGGTPASRGGGASVEAELDTPF